MYIIEICAVFDLISSGFKHLTLHDIAKVGHVDLSKDKSMFSETDIGSYRAMSIAKKLMELHKDLDLHYLTNQLDKEMLDSYSVCPCAFLRF
jgi:molybdopterin/thiamine biosynthesis adenylyltransferase